MLKSAGADEKAIAYAQVMKCSTCFANKMKQVPRVAKTKRAEGFNQQLNMDTFELQIYDQKKINMLNICDEERGFNCVFLYGKELLLNKSEKNTVSTGRDGLVILSRC